MKQTENSDTVQKKVSIETRSLKEALFRLHLLRSLLPEKEITVSMFPPAIEIRDR